RPLGIRERTKTRSEMDSGPSHCGGFGNHCCDRRSRSDHYDRARGSVGFCPGAIATDYFMRAVDKELVEAIWASRVNKVVDSLAQGADVNAANQEGWRPLMWAVLGGQVEIVRLLIERGADLEARDNNGQTALFKAADRRDAEITNLLLAAGCEIK